MVYDGDFYKRYRDYLTESSVRRAHDFVFKIASLNSDFKDVVDFGCGEFNEFLIYAKPEKYIGIDKEGKKCDEVDIRILQGDYRKIEILPKLILPSKPTGFVSLFSSEISLPFGENYSFYEEVFRQIPSIHSGLVSGFYYVSKKFENPVGETGGIVSYQTLESIDQVLSSLFEEKRIVLPSPSKMFGTDVYEVWKIFERK